MKKTLVILSAGLILFSACNKSESASGEFKTEREKVAYSLGVDIGRNIEAAKIDSLELETMFAGIRDVMNKKDVKISDEDAKRILMEFFNKKQQAALAEKGAKATKFFAENKKKAGVVTLPSGLQYQVIKEGTGPKPTINDKVTVHYHGTLLDGKVFDSSVETGQPATFPVGGVITGWTEGLQLMPVGSKWKLFIPSNLAYGERGASNVIGPNEPLIFEVELISINK